MAARRVIAVFGGGGAKAVAHAGAWRALVEKGLTPSHIVGTSMGAVVGAAFAAGLSFDEFVSRIRGITQKDVAPLNSLAFIKGIFGTSLFSGDGLRRTISKLIPVSRFPDFQIPLTVVATNLDSGDLVLFGANGFVDVPVRDALCASCALPVYYPPVVIDGKRYGDGGLRAVLPIEVARGVEGDLIVAINVGPGFDEDPPAHPGAMPSLIRAHSEAERIMMAAQTERDLEDWPADAAKLIVVRAVKEREATFALEHMERYIEAGYQETKRALG